MSSKFANWKCCDDYRLEKILGHGSYGEVALAIHRETDKKCAIKLMRDIFEIPVDAKRAYREIHILRHLRHVNIILLHEVLSPLAEETSSNFYKKRPIKELADLYLVFDFVDTDLSKIFRSDQHMGVGHIKYILYQLLLGLNYLHSANVIHRDIKPANILISCTNCSLKIEDFGLSRVGMFVYKFCKKILIQIKFFSSNINFICIIL
jgi:mitogen-activated protein kinase 1/3